MDATFANFKTSEIDTGETRIFVRLGGKGPPVLLLHGFPQTHLMWRGIAPILAQSFTIVCADLRGYGRSGCPKSDPDHAPYSKRAMASDMVALMRKLGHGRFSVAGHDRGGRVAYRMALDHPAEVERLAVLDIVPTSTAWDLADDRLALSFWPWSLLAQPEPLPEKLIAAAPEAVIDNALGGWGTPSNAYPDEVRNACVEALKDPAHIHAICEEYRAAATIDRKHDESDLLRARRIACPVLALWSGPGAVGTWYEQNGGPLALWRQWANDVEGEAIDGGHFFPEEKPDLTARLLRDFFSGSGVNKR